MTGGHPPYAGAPAQPPLVEPVETAAADNGTPPQPASPGWETQGAEVVSAKSFHVLFVCTANICRSASLEAMARHAAPLGTDLVFSSAGTHGWTDQGVDEVVRAALPADVDTTDFRSRQLTKDLLDEADLVLTAETAHRSHILDEQPQLFRKVYTLGQFAEAVAKAPEGLTRDELLQHVASARGPAHPALDVPDPYRRGPEAAAACVTRLDELLHVVLPALSR